MKSIIKYITAIPFQFKKFIHCHQDIIGFLFSATISILFTILFTHHACNLPIKRMRENRAAGLCVIEWWAVINWGSDHFLGTNYDKAREKAGGNIIYSVENCSS